MAEVAELKERTRGDVKLVTRRADCRLCKSKKLGQIWSFGPTPLANSYLSEAELDAPELTAPLDVFYCEDCHLVQLRDVVRPDLLFEDYLYVSSTSPTFVRHFEDLASYLVKRFELNATSLVVDVGSNDGVLLRPLQEDAVEVLGIDPAANIAADANEDGIDTWCEYFTVDVARKIQDLRGPAAVISANNVFAHTDNIDEFVEAVGELLADDGVFMFEVQYLGELINKNLFDIVYHEHLNYYHLQPLDSYFKARGFEIFDVQRIEVHGGSIRVFVQRHGAGQPRSMAVDDLLKREKDAGLSDRQIYIDFAKQIDENKVTLKQILAGIKEEGKRVVGFGAPAKATTLMYAFGLTGEDIEYIVDDAPLKQGRFMPGTHVPIVSADHFKKDSPDFCLILAWNFAEPIMKNNSDFASRGGKFIMPIPVPKIL